MGCGSSKKTAPQSENGQKRIEHSENSSQHKKLSQKIVQVKRLSDLNRAPINETENSKHSDHDEIVPAYTPSKPVQTEPSLKQDSLKEIKVEASQFIQFSSRHLSDDYEIQGKIGEGYFGHIRLALHKLTKQQRAIKSIEKRKTSRVNSQDSRFFREFEILKKTDHPNIIKVFEYFEDKSYWHIVTEYAAGGQLFDYIIKSRHLSEALAAKFMKQVISGISYCHQIGIIHGNMHPENILLSHYSDEATLKIIDFGTTTLKNVAESIDKNVLYHSYASPEILKAEQLTDRCDIWSCGVILYILLSGKLPFIGKTPEIIRQRVILGDYSLKGPEWKTVSDLGKDLVSKMLEYNPSRRPSALQVLSHDWMNTQKSDLNRLNSVPLALSSLLNYRLSQKLQQAVALYMSSQVLSRDQLQEMNENFRAIDKNSDGKISKQELLEAYEKYMNKSKAGEEVQKIMNDIDGNNSGFIDYSEFVAACMKQEDIENQNNLDLAFKAFDIDKNGKISLKELNEILSVGEEGSIILKEIDKDGDGEIDIAEFRQMMLAHFAN